MTKRSATASPTPQGLHISSKAIPNWSWATFENVNNPRCNQPPYVALPDDFGYPDGAHPSPRLKRLFRHYGITDSAWWNYRLVGVQNGYLAPPRLGNSFIERNMGPRVSCMACHAQVAAQPNGTAPPLATSCVGYPEGACARGAYPMDFLWGFSRMQATPPK